MKKDISLRPDLVVNHYAFGFFHGFDWNDFVWTSPVPRIAPASVYEEIVRRERPELLPPVVAPEQQPDEEYTIVPCGEDGTYDLSD